ncbi:MAG: TIGR03936 family radical SAM-associated protein [Pirellulaceae bacterium]
MTRQRVRIRFRKEGDLRLISHRDLLRLFERLFRRAELKLSMSEGFHPKARLSFPSALGLGIVGLDEVMEVELAESVDADALRERLESHLPAGIALNRIDVLSEGAKKAQVAGMTYEMAIPPERLEQTRRAAEQLMSRDSYPLEREGKRAAIDLLADLERLEITDDALRFSLGATRTAGARPRDVLDALGLSDLEASGAPLLRTTVEIAS